MIFTIKNHARENADVLWVFRLVSGLSWAQQGSPMCDLGYLWMGKFHLLVWLDVGNSLGS